MKRSLPPSEEMFESKQMILEQRRGSAKPEAAGFGGCPTAKRAAFLGGPDQRSQGIQLFSLLARFHEISSPMVELVLETGFL